MRKENLIAYIVTVLLFVGAGVLVFGAPKWDGLTNNLSLGNLFPKKEATSKPPIKTKKTKTKRKYKSSKIAKVVDVYNGVNIYYNGNIANVNGRSVTKDGYNLGLKYQCVEFVKRYYYENLNHKMPDSYGNAKEFFDQSLSDGAYNQARGLTQYSNKSLSKPAEGDILVFNGNQYNAYGHVAIISKVFSDKIEMVQQNPGPRNSSRAIIPLVNRDGIWELRGADILGWLRK